MDVILNTLKEGPNDDYAVYYIVNKNLKMNKGKIAAQCCHANTSLIQVMERKKLSFYKPWLNTGEATVVLAATAEQFQEIYDKWSKPKSVNDIWCVGQVDAGRTQVEPGTMTVIGFRPMKKSEQPDELKELKLL